MNKRIRAMVREVEKRGGILSISGSVPESVVESFLQEVLDCPCCHGVKDIDTTWVPDGVAIDLRLGEGAFKKRYGR